MTSYQVNARSRERDRLDQLSTEDASPRLRLAGVVPESDVDGPGYCFVVFAQGCPHHCPDCHNPQTHPFDGGFVTSVDKLLSVLRKNPLLHGLTLSGGEPFCQAAAFAALAAGARAIGLHIVTYSGFLFEGLSADSDPARAALLRNSDWLIDGPFIAEQKSLMLKFRGSKNQRVIDVAASLEAADAIQIEP